MGIFFMYMNYSSNWSESFKWWNDFYFGFFYRAVIQKKKKKKKEQQQKKTSPYPQNSSAFTLSFSFSHNTEMKEKTLEE